jgi:hypothetical protein
LFIAWGNSLDRQASGAAVLFKAQQKTAARKRNKKPQQETATRNRNKKPQQIKP